MIVRQFVDREGGCASYIVGCERGGQAAVIDPLADIGPYVAEAAARALRITHVVETHAHADHLSGAHGLSRLLGAPLLAHEAFAPGIPCGDVEDEEEHDLGAVRLTFLHAPGHTEGSLALLARDRSRPDRPGVLLSGDALLVVRIGRPEPEQPGGEWQLAEQLYHSVFGRLLALPDDVLLYPGHLSPVRGNGETAAGSSTIAALRRATAGLRAMGPSGFARAVSAEATPLGPGARAMRRRNLGYGSGPDA